MAKTLATAYHNLATMLEAGLPVKRCLNTIVAGLTGKLCEAFSAIARAISDGQTISDTMAKFPKFFSPLDILVVQAAEQSGKLPQAFELLSKWHDFNNRLHRILLSGMLFPLLIITVAAFVAPVPKLVLGGFNFLRYFYQVFIILAVFYIPVIVVFCIVRFTPPAGQLRVLLDSLVIRIPLLGQAVRHLALSRYCRVFNMLYSAGIPIVQCAEKAPTAAGNAIIAELFKPAAQSAKNGNPVSEGFSKELPGDFRELWSTGEETGKLDDITHRLADSHADTGRFLLETFCKWLPRILYFLICIWMIIKIIQGYAGIYSGRTHF